MVLWYRPGPLDAVKTTGKLTDGSSTASSVALKTDSLNSCSQSQASASGGYPSAALKMARPQSLTPQTQREVAGGLPGGKNQKARFVEQSSQALPLPGAVFSPEKSMLEQEDQETTPRSASQQSTAVGPMSPTSGMRGQGTSNPELEIVLQALKENEVARQQQQKQQADIARYLNELNAWLERDVVDRTREWRTVATGVTQLHDELAALKGPARQHQPSVSFANPHTPRAGQPQLDGAAPMSMPEPTIIAQDTPDLRNGTASPANAAPPTSLRPGGRAVPPPTVSPSFGNGGQWTNAMATPVIAPGPQPSRLQRAGTRAWHADKATGGKRDADEKRQKETDAAKDKWSSNDVDGAKKAKRRNSIKGVLGKAVAVATGAALVSAALNELNKHREKQATRSASAGPDTAKVLEEESSSKPLPADMVSSLKAAARSGDEESIREHIRQAAEVGLGSAAVAKVAEHVKSDDTGLTAESEADPGSDHTAVEEPARREPDGSKAKGKMRWADEDAVTADMGSSGRGAVAAAGEGAEGGALALAVGEILKHLLEKKEEEKKRQEELAALEARKTAEREAAKKERERKAREERKREKAELVEAMMAKVSDCATFCTFVAVYRNGGGFGTLTPLCHASARRREEAPGARGGCETERARSQEW